MSLDYPTGMTDKTAAPRTYGDPCGIARALDLLGERWAVLVVRELVLGPKRFTDLRSGLPGLSPDVLTERLRDLEQAGVVVRRILPPPAGARVYELTDWGRELEPVVIALGRWGSRAPFPPGGAPLGTDAFVLALKTLFDPSAAIGLSVSCELRLGGDRFHARVRARRLEVSRAGAARPDVIIETDTRSLSAVLWHGRRLSEAVKAGAVKIEGSRPVIQRFLGLFPPPKPAAA
jgi:DNA-binding HxlR family transcriptional regulator